MKFRWLLLMMKNDLIQRVNLKTNFFTLFTVIIAQLDVRATTNNPFENRDFIRSIDAAEKKSTILHTALDGYQDSSKKVKSILGDPLVSDSKFVMKLKRTCSTSLESCIYDQIKVDYLSLFQKLTQEKQFTLLKDGSLEVRLMKNKSDHEEQKMDVFLFTFLNGVKIDSTLIYSYLNIPENSIANETIYYIDDALNIWRLSVTYEENSISVDAWETLKINKKTGLIEH